MVVNGCQPPMAANSAAAIPWLQVLWFLTKEMGGRRSKTEKNKGKTKFKKLFVRLGMEKGKENIRNEILKKNIEVGIDI